MLIGKLNKQEGLLHCPPWLPNNIMFEGLTGSEAYGVSSNDSDRDIVGFCIPRKDEVFPHLRGEINGFGVQKQRFEQWQQHHIIWNNRNYDITIYNIVKFVQLAMENNPNMVDNLFLPRRCVLHSTPVYEHLRENRKMFLHKGSWHKFKGYAYSQLSKIDNGTNKANQKRQATIEEFGFDTKFAYHVIRLLLECEQILMEGDLDIEQNRELLKSVRRGEWELTRIKDWFVSKEKSLETLYVSSSLQKKPDEDAIKKVLLECLEMHYGTLEGTIIKPNSFTNIRNEMQAILDKYGV